MKLADKLLKCSSHNRYKLSSLCVKGGRLLSVGINKNAAPKRFMNTRPGSHLHAEVDCLLNLDREKTRNSTLYVAGKTAANNLMTTKPCKDCMKLIERMNVKRIVYLEKDQIKELEW